ncbi:MAG TPA: AmmeMemoRadiSam system protein B [Syntrophobacteraceae bacterium]|nr:AmmeMemoRadiSam system protein B [Syntrophobacteraceae bacterium]
MENPKLRTGVEALPVDVQGKTMILLRDQLGYCEDSLVFSPAAAQLLMRMDGTSSLRDLQADFMRQTGQLIYLEQLQEITAKLDEHLFLENERFQQRVLKEESRFRNDPVRRMSHAGKSYPAESVVLTQELSSYFVPENGGPGAPATAVQGDRLLGLMAPHIDIRGGGTCYAHAYKALCESSASRTWVILGTSHYPLENFFAVTCKDFETPLGTLKLDQQCAETLLQRSPRDLHAGEYQHRREHTIEFQAVFLALCQPQVQIVPMLCSFSTEDWQTEQGYIDELAASLGDLSVTCGYPVGLLASVDLAHIGPRYGDRFRPHAGTIREHLEADRELLATLEECNAAAFLGKLGREHNRRRICGMPPLYLLAKALQGRARGTLLHHTHTVVDQQQSFVTFASMAFHATGKT